MFSEYEENRFLSRIDYLEDLAESYDVPLEIVVTIADMLGPEEDFDGLVSAVEDYSYSEGV